MMSSNRKWKDRITPYNLMATATMATAVGAAVLVYLNLNRKIQSESPSKDEEFSDSQVSAHLGGNRISRRLIQAPATWLETITTLSETLRFTYSETLGKWPIADLAFGISFLLRRQGNLQASSVFGGEDSVELKGPEVVKELHDLLHLLTLCRHFSKKPFAVFLELTGYTKEDVLLQEPKAGILKPAFTVLVDHKSSCFLLLIRGTHSIKDTLTAATGAIVPFHHTVVNDGGVANVVLGYAHGGMVAAARWISKLSSPCLKSAIKEHPDYRLKIVGHSLGGGTAALLTYVLREQTELSSTTCVTFAPGACMTWELAESGVGFVTCVINGADLVPSFSAASVDDLRAEVTASAWVNDLRNQIEQTRILSTVYRSASALGSIGAGAIRPVSTGTQVVMKRASSMARAAWTTSPSWSCMGPRKRVPERCSVKCRDEFSGVVDEERTDEASSSVGEREEIKEVHRFYPPGRIMHIVSFNGSSSSDDSDEKVAVFLTQRKLYSKIRLSQTMVSDHFMPSYRRQIEKILEQSSDFQTAES